MEHTPNNINSLKSGTTIVGLRTDDFVIVASDQQSTMGYMADGLDVQKVHPITSNIVFGLAGSVGDAQQLIRVLKMESSMYENERNKKMSVKALVTLSSNIFNANRYYPYQTFFVIGGYLTKPELYGIDLIGGFDKKTNYTATGSGMTFALGVLDNKYNENMSKKEAIDLIVEAIKGSKKRDVFTGGENIDIYFVTKKGIENIKRK